LVKKPGPRRGALFERSIGETGRRTHVRGEDPGSKDLLGRRARGADVVSRMVEVYGWVRETRKGLLEWCGSLPADVYLQERREFGWGSIRNTLVHAADCYRFWLAEEALGREVDRFEPRGYPDAPSAFALFKEVDDIVAAFVAKFPGEELSRPLSRRVRWRPDPLVISPLWLLAHTVTHEFHHKGQIVAIARQMGYEPPNTDVLGTRD